MLFGKKENKDELVNVLGEIRDNLSANINAEDLQETVKNLEFKIDDVQDSVTSDFNVEIKKLSKEINDVKSDVNDMILRLDNFNNKFVELENQFKQPAVKKEATFTDKYLLTLRDSLKKDYVSLKFDGFYFKGGTGIASKMNLFTILDIIDMENNLETICEKLVAKTVTTDYYCELYDIKPAVFPRVLYNIITTNIFQQYIDDFNAQHTYQFIEDVLYIDEVNTGLKLDDVKYIKSCIENSNNKKETIQNFTSHFNNINNKYITIISTNIEKIPQQMLQKEISNVFENNPEKRKEQGMI